MDIDDIDSNPDVSVQRTSDDAIGSKQSAVNLGYYQDPYVHFFARTSTRRAPIINRGYYARVKGIDQILDLFLRTFPESNVIVLGAGQDTTFFRLHDKRLPIKNYVEVDFPTLVQKKIRTILRNNPLRNKLENVQVSEKGLSSDHYQIMSADLRDLEKLSSSFIERNIEFSAPTIVILECVLVYLQSQPAIELLEWISRQFPSSVVVIFDMVNPNDRFGQTMLRNLQMSGCFVPGFENFPTLQSQVQRLKLHGFELSMTSTMRRVYEMFLEKTDLQRISKIEIFDEVEEWNLIMEHYCLTIGISNCSTLSDFLQVLDFPAQVNSSDSIEENSHK